MPSYTFENLADVATYANTTENRLAEILQAVREVSRPPIQQTNAAGTRTVTTETAPPPPPAPPVPAPTLPVSKPPAADTELGPEANALRLALGSDYSALTDYAVFGDHTYVPDFRAFCHVIHEMDELIQTARHFYLSSLNWHPLLSQAYYCTCALLFTLDIQVQTGVATTAQRIAIDNLKRQFSFDVITIPGPLVKFFEALASGRTNIGNTEVSVCPTTSTIRNASAATFGLPATAAAARTSTTPRVPSILALLDQYVRVLNIPAPAAGAGTHAHAISIWPDFGVNVLGTPAITAARPDFADPTALAAGLNNIQTELFRTPGFNKITNVTNAIAANIAETQVRARANFPTRNALAAATASTVEAYCALNINQGNWFTWSARIMTKYSQFFKGSKALSKISPVGSACGQVTFEFVGTPVNTQPATRYDLGAAVYSFKGQTRSSNVSAADDLDAHVTLWNTDSFLNVTASHRSGTFWTHEGIKKEARPVDTYVRYGPVIQTHFFTANPKM